jgi:hypothetical protein
MTATKEEKVLVYRPLSIVNCYEILSSDGKTLYPLVMTDENACLCGCPGGMYGKRGCWHRTEALKTFTFYMYQSTWEEVRLGRKPQPVETWEDVLDRIEAQAEIDEVEALFAA